MRPSRLGALFLASCLFLTSTSALAQMSESEKKAAARAAYAAGVQLQDQGKPAEALEKFQGAQKLYDAPTHLLHIAECQALLGKLVEASETYQSMIVKPLPPGSPDVFVQAVDQAKAEAPGLRARIPTLKITVKPDPKTLQGLTIATNDKTMPNELIDIARPVNPGQYRVTAQANGWTTRGPVDFELKEKENKALELELVQGSGGAVVAPVPPPYGGTNPPGGGTSPAGTTDPNAGAEKPKPPPKDEGNTTGLLFGAHGGLFVPAGDIAKNNAGANTSFDTVATAGGGVGIDLLARFAKVFLVGGRVEGLFLGGPDAKKVPQGTTVTSTSNMFGAAIVLGVLTSQDKVGFYGDLGFGYRQLNFNQTQPQKVDISFNGTYFALGAGISIPAGPIRIIPKVGVDLGSLKPKEATITTPNTSQTFTANDVQSAGYQMFFVGIDIFYSLDLGKKQGGAAKSGGGLATF